MNEECVHAPDALVRVALATDEKLVAYVPTLLNSISHNTSRPVKALVLTRNLDPRHSAALKRLNLPRVSVELMDMSQILTSAQVELLPHTTISTMDRIFLPELMPEAKKVVYIDVDTIVLGDVAQLFETPTPPIGICAKNSILPAFSTLDKLIDKWGNGREQMKDLIRNRGEGLDSLCFNAGVLVLDLEALRKHAFTAYCIDQVIRFGINDQLALNLFSAGRHERLEPGWNVFIGQDAPDHQHILHWVGPTKPWSPKPVKWRERWLEYHLPLEFE